MSAVQPTHSLNSLNSPLAPSPQNTNPISSFNSNQNQNTLSSASPASPSASRWTVFWHKVWNALKYTFTCCGKYQKKEVKKFIASPMKSTAEEKKTQQAPVIQPVEKQQLLINGFPFPKHLILSEKPVYIIMQKLQMVFKFVDWNKDGNEYLLTFFANVAKQTSVCGCCYILVDADKQTAQWRLRLNDFIDADLHNSISLPCPGPIIDEFRDIYEKLCEAMNLTQEKNNPYGDDYGRAFANANPSYSVYKQIESAVSLNQPQPSTSMSQELAQIVSKLRFWHLLYHNQKDYDSEWVSSPGTTPYQRRVPVTCTLQLIKTEEDLPQDQNCPKWHFKLTWQVKIIRNNDAEKTLGHIIVGITKDKTIALVLEKERNVAAIDEDVLRNVKEFTLDMKPFFTKIFSQSACSDAGNNVMTPFNKITIQSIEELKAPL